MEIKLPQWGMAMNEGTVVSWYVAEGDQVEAGQEIVEVEAAKTTQTVASPVAGTVAEILVAQNETVAPKTVLCTILEVGAADPGAAPTGEPEGDQEAGDGAPAAPEDQIPAKADVPEDTPVVADENLVRQARRSRPDTAEQPRVRRQVAPRARKIARDNGVDIESIEGSGPNGRVIVADVEAALHGIDAEPGTMSKAETATPQVLPLARKKAKEAGIDLAQITGTGREGRILPGDVEAAIAARSDGIEGEQASEQQRPDTRDEPQVGPNSATLPEDAAPVPDEGVRSPSGNAPASSGHGGGEAQHGGDGKTARLRTIIAQRMMESLRSSAQFTMHTTADVTDLVAYRSAISGVRPSFTDAVIRASALALREHPDLNVRFEDGAIVPVDTLDIGMAVAVEGALMVPVVRGADRLGLADLAAQTRDLVSRARAGTLTAQDMGGGSFSVTSLGGQGIDGFTPILNTPESAILGVGRIKDVPTRYGDDLVWRQELTLSLTVDHRAVDGYPGALFLQRVAELLALPRALTLGTTSARVSAKGTSQCRCGVMRS